MKTEVEKLSRLISRLTQLQGVFEEIATKQYELAALQRQSYPKAIEGNTDLGHKLLGMGDAYGDVAKSLCQLLNGADSVFHLSEAAEYLYCDCVSQRF